MKKINLIFWIAFLFGLCLPLASAVTWDNVEAWTFDNNKTTGTSTYGMVSNIEGELKNGATSGVSGTSGEAFNFNAGDNEYVNLNKSVQSAFDGDFTISLWVNPDRDSTTEVWFDSRSPTTNNDGVQIYSSSGTLTTIFNFGGTSRTLTGDALTSAGGWYNLIVKRSGTNVSLWQNGIYKDDDTNAGNDADIQHSDDLKVANNRGTALPSDGQVDEVYIWERALSDAECLAVGTGSYFIQQISTYSVTLTSPSNTTAISSNSANFTANYSITGVLNWSNTTYYVWYENGTVFNNSVVVEISGTSNSTTELIGGMSLGNYLWNVNACLSNGTCVWAENNYSFSVGASINTHSYSNTTWETKSENFLLTIDLLNGSEISLAQLVYSGVNYTISNVSTTATSATLSLTIDIPLNSNPLANQTNTFYYRFTYEGSQVQTIASYSQNVSFINLQFCNSTFSTEALNFTLTDETSQEKINASATNTNFQAYFTYWLGSGNVIKNYSYGALDSSTMANYTFCIYPHDAETYYGDSGMMSDMVSLYSADTYSEREYFLTNATLTNATSNILLFLLNDSSSVKFTFTVKQGTSFLQDAYITVSKFFIGDGVYKTISIRKTDDSGQFVEYLELDRDYRYSIVKGGALLGVIERRSACATAPCEETLQIDATQGNIWSSYSNVYAANVLSNLTFNSSTNIVAYNFLDVTGLANYFRLEVARSYNNQSGEIICNEISYSSSGTLTCDVSGYYGDFIAKTYISRSPEKIDRFLSFFVGELKETLGSYALFISFAIIVTLVFAGAAISGGNPSVILFMFGLAILITKLMTIFPFSWGVVSLLLLLDVFLISKVRT